MTTISPSEPASTFESPEIVGWPTLLPDHLSPSSLKMWMRCREQWRRRYVLGEKERPGAALVWGTAHNYALVETNFGQKITSGRDLTIGDVELAFAEGFDQRVAADGDEIQWGEDKPAELKDRGVILAAEYHRQVSPSVQPLQVEEAFSLDLPGVPVPVVGRMDVSEEKRTIDLKTGNKREMKPDNAFQGRVYQLARPLPIEFHLATKTKTPGIYTPKDWPEFGFEFSEFVQTRTERILADLARDIVATYDEFGPDRPWPGAFTYGWACGYCGFKPTCAYWVEAPVSVSFALSTLSASEGGVEGDVPQDRGSGAAVQTSAENGAPGQEVGLAAEALEKLHAEEETLVKSIENIAVKNYGTEKLVEARAVIKKCNVEWPDDPQARIDFLKRMLMKAIEAAS